jgi:hypothetical protein
MAIETAGEAFPAPRRIGGNTRANVKGLWFFTVLWNAVSAPILVYVPPELGRQPLAWLGFLFPVVGVGLLGWAIVTTARARRFGQTWLDTTAAVARPGHTWRATVHAALPQPDSDSSYTVQLKLTCLSRTLSRHGDDCDEREHILWREETELDSSSVSFGADGASVPVRFDIPGDALQTTAVGKGAGILWVLTVEARLPGVDLKEDFDVPVRGTGSAGSSASAEATAERQNPQPRTAVTIDDLARTGIRVEPSPEGTSVTFAPARNLAFAANVTGLTAVFVGALWLQWYLGFPWIFWIVTGLVDLLLVYVVIDLWFGKTVVVAGHGTLQVRHSLLGVGGRRTWLAAEIAAIDLHVTMQTQGRYGTPYYAVRARLKTGRKMTLGSGVRNKRHAEWLAQTVRSSLGLK